MADNILPRQFQVLFAIVSAEHSPVSHVLTESPVSIRVLFLQSQSGFGADSAVHARLMRHFDRSSVEIHVACTEREPADGAVGAITHLRSIPDLRIRLTDFGPSIHAATAWTRARRVLQVPIVPLSLLSLASYVRRHQIQLIHATEKPRDAFYGVLLGKLTGAKSVVHMHVCYGDWQNRAVKWALGNANAIVGVSRFTSQTIINAGYTRARVFAVHNSLDLSEWDHNLDGRSTRRELGLTDDVPVVGIVARLFKWKGHGDLLDALAIVRNRIPNVRLVIVGEDDPFSNPGGGSYRAELAAQTQRLGLDANVIFTGLRSDIPRLMAAFDVFAMPSWEEPFGMVYLEAMAMEKPVVAWASGGVTEIVLQDQTGVLVEPKSVPDLADALTRLLGDSTLRLRFGKAGRRRVEQVFNPREMCRAMLGVYEATLDGAPGRVPRSAAN